MSNNDVTQTLKTIVPRLSIGDCASGHIGENRSKSRDNMILPREKIRSSFVHVCQLHPDNYTSL